MSAPRVELITTGHDPEILFVHGGASPSTTWGPLAPLAARWTLMLMHRRVIHRARQGEAWAIISMSTDDIVELLETRPHVVALRSSGRVSA